MTTISQKAIDAILASPDIKRKVHTAIMNRFGLSSQTTVQTWLTGKNVILTTPDAVEIISTHTGLPSDQILEKVAEIIRP